MTNEEREQRIRNLRDRIKRMQGLLDGLETARQCRECDRCIVLRDKGLCKLPSWPIEPSVIDPDSYEICEFFWEKERIENNNEQKSH
jgi:hypothetical protein